MTNTERILTIVKNDPTPPNSDSRKEYIKGDAFQKELEDILKKLTAEGVMIARLDDCSVFNVEHVMGQLAKEKGMRMSFEATRGMSLEKKRQTKVGGLYGGEGAIIVLDSTQSANVQLATLLHEMAHMLLAELYGMKAMSILDQEPLVELIANQVYTWIAGRADEGMDARTVNYLKSYAVYCDRMLIDRKAFSLSIIEDVSQLIWREYVCQ